MLRSFMFRHGAHHVNIWSLSGSSARPVSTSPFAMIRCKLPQRFEKSHFCGKVLAPVRGIDGGEGHSLDVRGHDSAFVVERGVLERGALGGEGLLDVKADPRIALRPVPVAPIPFHLA